MEEDLPEVTRKKSKNSPLMILEPLPKFFAEKPTFTLL